MYIGFYFQKETQIYAAPDMPLSSGFSKISRNDISVTPFSAVDWFDNSCNQKFFQVFNQNAI